MTSKRRENINLVSFICLSFLVVCNPCQSSSSVITLFFFYKNIFYKNIEAEICEILRIF